MHNTKEIKKLVVDALLSDGYSTEEVKYMVKNAELYILDDTVTVVYANGVRDTFQVVYCKKLVQKDTND